MLKTLLFTLTLATISSAFADRPGAVVDCSLDKSTQDDILTNIPNAEERLEVRNKEGAVVGAFDYDPKTGNIGALYLCGDNSNYYYVSGNLLSREVSAIYNDEYESEVNASVLGSQLQIDIKNMTFVGDAEDADHAPFSTSLFVELK